MAQAGDITRLLQQADSGDAGAAANLFGLVQKDLRAIARKRKRIAEGKADVCTTVLVDDAFLRLVGVNAAAWNAGDRRKFFGYAARQMHDMLVKGMRGEAAQKRGGGRRRVDADDVPIADPRGEGGAADLLLDLKEALERFERFAPQDALLFRLRTFLGCTFEEVAEMLGMSPTEAKRCYHRARLWLETELKEYGFDA